MRVKRNKYNSWKYDTTNSQSRKLVKRLKNKVDRRNNIAMIKKEKEE